jgi:hypothetical protein
MQQQTACSDDIKTIFPYNMANAPEFLTNKKDNVRKKDPLKRVFLIYDVQ